MNQILEEDLKDITSQNIDFEKLKDKSVLITGASGMIGSYLVRTLVFLNETKNLNIKILALVRNSKKLSDDIINKIKIIEQDVCKPVDIDDNIDYIIHTASPASPDIMKKYPISVIKANTLGTINTLDLAVKKNAIYMFVSSREAYGEPIKEKCAFKEDDMGLLNPVNVRSCYSEGKRAGETLCASYQVEEGINVKIVRPAYVYGPGMSLNDSRVQTCFINDVMNNRDICLNSAGSAVRSYIYISDVISGMFYVLLNSKDTVYNIADDKCIISIKELARTIIKASGKDLKLTFNIPKENKGVSNLSYGILDMSKLCSLGWKPKYNVLEGFKRTIKYFEIENYKN